MPLHDLRSKSGSTAKNGFGSSRLKPWSRAWPASWKCIFVFDENFSLICLRTCHFHRFTWFAVPETFRSICVLRKWMIRSSTYEHLLVVVHTKKKSNARWIAFCVVSIFSADRGDCWHIFSNTRNGLLSWGLNVFKWSHDSPSWSFKKSLCFRRLSHSSPCAEADDFSSAF